MRVIIYTRQAFGQGVTQGELLRKSIEDRGDTVIAVVADDPAITGKGKYAGWRAALSELAQIDQIVVGSAGDLPGKSTTDLIKIMETLCDHGVSVVVGDIDTGSGSAAVLDLVAAYRGSKRSEAIKAGQAEARAAGTRLGRPAIPDWVRQRIVADLRSGLGVRAAGRKNNVSGASVINVRRLMAVTPERRAA
jgi:DNA invertase Pin-like site-specific DNA recombinase